MGSKDLVDMIRKVDGLQRITDSDQVEIKKLQEDKAELDHQKSEKNRLKADVEAKKAENEKNKKETEKVQKQKKKLLEEYRKQEAELNEKMRSVQVDIASIQNLSLIHIFSSLDFEHACGYKNGGFFMRPPFRADLHRIDLAWALVGDIACSIFYQYRQLLQMLPIPVSYTHLPP